MNIDEALNELTYFIDMIYGVGVLTDEEEERISEVENTIIQYVNERN